MVSDWAARPTIRARDIDREYAMGLLRHAAGDGQLGAEEFERRLAGAMRARTLGDLAALVGDLRSPVDPSRVVPVLPVVPYPYVYAPSRPVRPRLRRRGLVVAVVGVVALLLLLAALASRQAASVSGVDVGTPEYVIPASV
jgi:hypothetical protein